MPPLPRITLPFALLLILLTASMALSGCIWPGPHYRRVGRPAYVNPDHNRGHRHNRRPSHRPSQRRWQDDNRRPRG